MAAGSFYLQNLLRSKYVLPFLCFTLIIHGQQGFGQDTGEIETFDLLMPNVLPKKVSVNVINSLIASNSKRKSTDQ